MLSVGEASVISWLSSLTGVSVKRHGVELMALFVKRRRYITHHEKNKRRLIRILYHMWQLYIGKSCK